MPRKYSRENGDDPQESALERVRSNPDSGAKPSNFGRNVLILLAIIGALFLFNGFAFISSLLPKQALPSAESIQAALAPKENLPQGVAMFSENYGDRLIPYYDKYYGFQISYPIGYAAMLAPEPGTYVRFQADYPGSSSELIDVQVFNGTGAKDLYGAAVSELANETLQSNEEIPFGWRKAYLASGSIANPVGDGSNFLVREGFFDCTTPAGEAYSVAIVAAIPQEFEQDALLASYMIRTFKC